MKKRFVPLLLGVAMLGGCSRISHIDGVLEQTRSATTPVFTDVPELHFTAGANDPYENVVQHYVETYETAAAEDETLHPYQYVLYDMDGDDTAELIVRVGTCEADYLFCVWTVDADGNPMQIDGEAGASHTTLYGSDTENGFYCNSCHMDTQNIMQYTLTEGNTLEETAWFQNHLEGDGQIAYGYYDLTGADGFFQLVEQDITAYTYAESEHIRTAAEPMTIEEYQQELARLDTEEAVG